MRLYEYQGKQIFRNNNIPTPRGKLASSSQEVFDTAKEIGKEVVVKAQVLIGGRDKAGGIILAKTAQEAKELSCKILGKKIRNLAVNKLLVEEAVHALKEFYLGLAVDRSKRKNTLIFATEGGIDIEDLALKNPKAIFKRPVARCEEVDEVLKDLKKEVELESKMFDCLADIIKKIFQIYFNLDCELVEINPLVLNKNNEFIALDAKIIIDDNALFRQEEIASLKEITETDSIETEAHRRRIAYVRLDGDVGIIGNGAGLVMATMDVVERAGIKPANFLDIGGGAKQDVMKNALEIILMDTNVKGIFINIFGGITRCDEVAKGLIVAFSQRAIDIPVVIRLQGTRCKEAKELLKNSQFACVDTMNEGAKKIKELVSV